MDNSFQLDITVNISAVSLDVQTCLDEVGDPAAGGIDLFVGTVREYTKGRKVIRLEFEAYEKMALQEMRKIGEKALDEFGLCKVSIHHRTGILNIGEIAVIIAASAPHRGGAFDACRYAIDTLKQTVPIWKKEVFVNGEVWVAAHP